MASIAEYCESVRGKEGAAAAVVVRQALATPHIYFYGQLLQMPEVEALRGTAHGFLVSLLELFAFGTYSDATKLPAEGQQFLTATMKSKLRQLSLVSLCAKSRRINYQEITAATEISDTRELEDLIIDTITTGLLSGRIDQRAAQLEVFEVSARDVNVAKEVDIMIGKMERWLGRCEVATGDLSNCVSATKQYDDIRDADRKKFEEREAQVMEVCKKIEYEEKDKMMEMEMAMGSAGRKAGAGGRDPMGGHRRGW